MGSRTHCDWCGKHISLAEDDYAVMPVTIRHPRGRSTLDARWAEEARPTHHFCASPREDVDRTGTNRMGLVPENRSDSCCDRAIATIEGTKLGDPGMGMEWRLVPVGEESQPAVAGPRKHEQREGEWSRLSSEERDRQVFERLGDGQFTTTEVTRALLDDGAVVYQSNVQNVVRRLFMAGQLERIAEQFQGKTRYRYFRKGGTSVAAGGGRKGVRDDGNLTVDQAASADPMTEWLDGLSAERRAWAVKCMTSAGEGGIGCLGLDFHTYSALLHDGIATVDDLKRRMAEEDLAAIHGIGPSRISRIQTAVAAYESGQS